MQQLPANEPERAQSVCELNQVDTPAEERFDRITRLAGRLFGMPVAMMTLMEEDRQWFKSARGHLINETPRNESFCQYTILQEETLVVTNVDHELYRGLPAVSHLGVKFYAGVPVRQEEGLIVGTLCVLDFEERSFDDDDLQSLTDLAHCVETELRLDSFHQVERRLLAEMDQLRRQASLDQVARCWNADFGRQVLEKMLEELKPDSRRGLGIFLLNLDRLTDVHRQVGQEAADFYLREAANRIRISLPPNASLSRGGAATFQILLPELEATKAEEGCRTIMDSLSAQPFVMGGQALPMEATGGFCLHAGLHKSPTELIDFVSKALIRARDKGPGTLRQAL